MKLTYRDKIMLIGAVVIILWAIGIFLIIKPAFSDMDEKSKTKDSKDNEVVVLQQRVDQEANLKDDLQKAYDQAVEHTNEYFYKLDTKESVTDTVRDLLYTKKREIVNTSYKINDLESNAVTNYSYSKAEVSSSLQEQVDLIKNSGKKDDSVDPNLNAAAPASIYAYSIDSDYECTLEELLAFADSLESTDQQSFIIESISVEDVNEKGKITGQMAFKYYMAPKVPKPAALGGDDDDKKDEAKDDKEDKDESSKAS